MMTDDQQLQQFNHTIRELNAIRMDLKDLRNELDKRKVLQIPGKHSVLRISLGKYRATWLVYGITMPLAWLIIAFVNMDIYWLDFSTPAQRIWFIVCMLLGVPVSNMIQYAFTNKIADDDESD